MQPGQPRVNRLPNLERFLLAWDEPSCLLNIVPVDVRVTECGNINTSGQVGDFSGHAITRWHPQFESLLEPGVRDLVRLVVDRFDWITYSSCEGHRYEAHALRPSPRHLGLVPRSEEEVRSIEEVLRAAIAETERRSGADAPVTFEVLVYSLEGSAGEHPAIDLFFRPRGEATWEEYFHGLEPATRRLQESLEALAPAAPSAPRI